MEENYQNILWEIKDSHVAGKGVFALIDLGEGQNLGLAFEKVRESGNPDKDFKRTDLGAFVNHSENKNLEIMKEGRKPDGIKKDDFLIFKIKSIFKNQFLKKSVWWKKTLFRRLNIFISLTEKLKGVKNYF